MFRDMKLPEGKVTKVFVGGTDALKKILPLLSRKKFTGYLRIVEKNNRAHGYVVMRQGRRVLTAVLDSNGVSTGKEALPRFRKLTRSPGAMIEVHVDLDVDSAIKALKELHGKGPAGLGAFKRRLEEWRKEGRDAGSPEAITDRDLSEAIKAFADQTEKATSAADLEEIVERALAEGLRAEGKEPRKRTREGSLQEPKKETEARRRKTTRGKEAERARLKAPRAEESSSVSGEPRRVRSTGDVTRDIGLLEKYTFENYVVGDSNRFAYAACLAVAEGSVDPYNPLFVVGKPGLGKTHLLQALGNRMLERAPKTKLRYLSARR
ncbi:MAG: DnaA ATPase domain-containing protein, partial [Thermoplasmata archaeon]